MIMPETVLQDLRYGARMLYRNIGFTTVAVLALAVGIGANTTVFTAYKATVARPLDARDPGTMVNLALIRHSGVTDPTFSYPDYEAYRDHLHSFSGVIAQSLDHLVLSGAGGIVSERTSVADSLMGRLGLVPPGVSNAEFASTFFVSENYFSVLGVPAVRGRTFESISIPDLVASPLVLISENYWQKRFAADPGIRGRTIYLNRAAFTIAGITPRDFVGTSIFVPDFWLPLSLKALVHPVRSGQSDREDECCRLFARLAPGVDAGQAQAEMTLLADRLRALHDPLSESSKPVTALVWPGSPFPLPIKQFVGLKIAILLIMAAAGMVLAIACANVASLQLARARARQSELGTRLSLGATRTRVIRQLLTESILLGLLAGTGALPFTWVLTHVLAIQFVDALPAHLGTLVFHVTPDLGILGYVFAISVVAGILFGLTPAIESSGSALASAFKAKAGTASGGSRRLQDFLIAGQVAFSLVLIIAGSLFISSAVRSLTTETGYELKHVVDLHLKFPEESKYTDDHKLALVRELRSRLAALPGVTAVTSAESPEDGFRTTRVSANGEKPSEQNLGSILHYTYIQPNYFEMLGIPMFMGSGFRSQTGEPEHSVILSESAAKQLWPGQIPIGRSLRFSNNDHSPYQVIGVVRDVRGIELDGSDVRMAYLPLREDRIQTYPILIRTQADSAQLIRAIDAVISSTDSELLASASTLEDMLRQTSTFFISSLSAIVASTIGLLGLLLVSMGIYGTVSYIAVRRTREIGIRMAIGAQKRDILGLMLRESMRPVLVGLLAGICLAVGVSYVLRGLFYGLNTVDGISFAGVSLLFSVIALLAAYGPSRRAMRVDPMEALRYE